MSRPRLIGWMLVLVTLLAYLPVLRNDFVNLDDPDYVTRNSVVQRGIDGPGINWAFASSHASNWHPVTWLSHMADCELFRLNPAGHHLVNLLFHAANVWLLFMLWLRLTRATWASAMIAALFAWHPLHVESVAWIAERKDVLSTFFALLALLNYASYAQGSLANAASPAKAPVFRYYRLAALFFALGLMSKPMVVTLPFVMLLLDFWPLQRKPFVWRLVLEKWPFFLLSAASCALTVLAQRAEAIAPLAKYSLGLRLENTVVSYVDYLLQMIWPAPLAVFYPMPTLIPWPTVAAAAALLVVISALVWRAAKTRPYLPVGWLWYLGTLVPVIGLVQVGDQSRADRYTYFPLIGIFCAITWAVKDLAPRWPHSARWLAATAAVVLGACLLLDENQLRYWRNSETLFVHALATTDDNTTARLNLGAAFQAQNRIAEAMVEYHAALRLDPRCHEAYNNIGRILNEAGRPAEALEYCTAATALNQRSPLSHNSLGIVLAELNRFDEAKAQFSEATRLDPNYAAPHFQMGRLLLKSGHDGEAVPQFREALRLEPENFAMLIYVARVLAADEKPEARDGAQALALAQKAAQFTGTAPSVTLDTLAMACAESGHFDQAQQIARQAMDAALAGGAREDVTNIQNRLKLYQMHQPARMSFQNQ